MKVKTIFYTLMAGFSLRVLDPLSIWKIFCRVFNLLYSSQIQELFRCQKRSCSYVKGRERKKWRLHKSNEEKNSVNKINFPQILFYKYPENLRIDFMLKKKILQMRLISLFFYYSLNFKSESFECHEKQYLYSRSKIILLQLLTSTLQFLEESMGRLGFLRPVLDICFAMI